MEQSVKVVAVEVLGLGMAVFGIVDTIRDRARAPIPQRVLNDGWWSLHPQYRRKVDRTLGGWLRRAKVAVDVCVRRWSRKR